MSSKKKTKKIAKKPAKGSMMTRVMTGKICGLIIGSIAFFVLPHLMPEAPTMLRVGILLWYITFGAIIGAFGFFTTCPITKMTFPWWFRDMAMGAWLNFVLVFFAHKDMEILIITLFGPSSTISPFVFAIEGALVGLIIGAVAKHFGGSGKEITG